MAVACVYLACHIDLAIVPAIQRSTALTYMRGVFAAVIFCTELHEVFWNPSHYEQTIYFPLSKLRPAAVNVSGWRQLSFFTHWSWLLLGSYFALVALSNDFDGVAYILWEIASANALLVTLVVTWVIWPEKCKAKSDTSPLASWPVLLQHNFNTIFVAAELHMARTAVSVSHAPIVPLYGLLYVLFLWFWSHRMSPQHGVQFYYPFLDTTLPAGVGVISLAGLLLALEAGFFAVAGAAYAIHNWSADPYTLAAIMYLCVALTCKWRD